MPEEFTIIRENKPEESAWGIVGRGVAQYNREQAGDNHFQRLCFVLMNKSGDVVGGVIAEVYWDWLYIDLLWVKEEIRRQGFGQSLMLRTEEEARQMGAENAYLDAFRLQAPEFHKDLAYHSSGELSDFPKGLNRLFIRTER